MRRCADLQYSPHAPPPLANRFEMDYGSNPVRSSAKEKNTPKRAFSFGGDCWIRAALESPLATQASAILCPSNLRPWRTGLRWTTVRILYAAPPKKKNTPKRAFFLWWRLLDSNQ